VLDPAALAGLPPVVADAVRQGLADQLHLVFLIALPLAAVVFLATLAIKPLALRETAHTEVGPAQEAGHELLDTMAQQAAGDEPVGVEPTAHGDQLSSERELVRSSAGG